MFSFFRRNKKAATGGQPGGWPGSPEPIPLMPFGPPANELEVALLAKYEKRMDALAFLNLLLNSDKANARVKSDGESSAYDAVRSAAADTH